MHRIHLALVAAAAIASSQAMAGLNGDTVGTRYVGGFGGDTGVQLSVVGAGDEGNFFSNQVYDYTDSGFSIRSVGNYCGIYSCDGSISLELSSLDLGTPITSVSISSSLSGVEVSFTDDSVSLTWAEQPLTPSTYLQVGFNTPPVPEPGTYALMALGLAGVGVAARRRRAG